ncbi:MAG: autotransporter outer membrane beta-barrel domain-containing protein [Elusimicrobium sp.]|jgi:outer membrane autotransporter protein|nr:autotransporter outer membrane beta-barrel domain-containing protein [Elusimicrobium sp.]
MTKKSNVFLCAVFALAVNVGAALTLNAQISGSSIGSDITVAAGATVSKDFKNGTGTTINHIGYVKGLIVGNGGTFDASNTSASTATDYKQINFTGNVSASQGTVNLNGATYNFLGDTANIAVLNIKNTATVPLNTFVIFQSDTNLGQVNFLNDGSELRLMGYTHNINADMGTFANSIISVTSGATVNGSIKGAGTVIFDNLGGTDRGQITVNADITSDAEVHDGINVKFNNALAAKTLYVTGTGAQIYLMQNSPLAAIDFSYSTGQNKIFLVKDSVFSSSLSDLANLGLRKDNRLVLSGKNIITSPQLSIGRIDTAKGVDVKFNGAAAGSDLLSAKVDINNGAKVTITNYTVKGDMGFSKGGGVLNLDNVNMTGGIYAEDDFKTSGADPLVLQDAAKKSALNLFNNVGVSGDVNAFKTSLTAGKVDKITGLPAGAATLYLSGNLNILNKDDQAFAGSFSAGNYTQTEITGGVYNTNVTAGLNTYFDVQGDFIMNAAAPGTLKAGNSSFLGVGGNIENTNVTAGNAGSLIVEGDVINNNPLKPLAVKMGNNSSGTFKGDLVNVNVTMGNGSASSRGFFSADGSVINTSAKALAFKLGSYSDNYFYGDIINASVSAGANSTVLFGKNVGGNISSGGDIYFAGGAAQSVVSGTAAAKGIHIGTNNNADVVFNKTVKGDIIFDNPAGVSAKATVKGALTGNVLFGANDATFVAGTSVSGQIYADPYSTGYSRVEVYSQTNAKGALVDTVFNKEVMVSGIFVFDDAGAVLKKNTSATVYLSGLNSKVTIAKALYGNINATASGTTVLNAGAAVYGNIYGGSVVTKGAAYVQGNMNLETLTLGKGKFTFAGQNLVLGSGVGALTLGAGQTLFLPGNSGNVATFSLANLTLQKGALLDLNSTKFTVSGDVTVDKGATVNSVLVNQSSFGSLAASNIYAGSGAAAFKVAVAANFDEKTNGQFEIIKANTVLDPNAFTVTLAKNRLFNMNLITNCSASSICVDVLRADGLPLSAGVASAGTPSSSGAAAVMDTSVFAASFKGAAPLAMRGAFTQAVENGSSNAQINNLFALAQFDDTLGDFNKALNAWAPDARGVTYYAQANRKGIQNSTYDRTQGSDAAQDAEARQSVWLSGFYNETDQSSRGNGFGFNGYTGGAAVGVDKYFTDKLLLGLAYAYTDAGLVYGGKAKINGNSAVLYGAYDFTPEVFVNAFGSYTDSDYKDEGYGVTAKYGGYQLSFDAQAGYKMAGGDFDFTPIAGAGYNRTRVDGYTDSASQSVLGASAGAWQLEAGLKAGYNMKNTGSVQVKPRVSLLASYDLNDGRLVRGAVLPGGGLYFVGNNNSAPWGLDAGLGADLTLRKNGLKLSADVKGLYKDGYSSTTYSAAVRLPF